MVGVGYVRVSTEQQIENYSIQEQKEKINQYAKLNNIKLKKIYCDEGWSGANLDRPSFKDMINDTNKRQFDIIVVYKLDRISRRTKDLLYFIEEVVNKCDIELHSVSESLNSKTPSGMLFISQLAAFAQYELNTITERMKMGKEARAKEGLWRGGSTVPFGYRYINGKLVICEEEAKQIREVYSLYLQGYGRYTISRKMYEKYGERTKSWGNYNKIKQTLERKLYAGKITWNGKVYEGQHEAIIDKNTFEEVQRLIKEREAKYAHDGTNKRSLLGGLLYCKECGNKMTLDYKKYRCKARRQKDPKFLGMEKCKADYIEANFLDSIVINEVLKLNIEEYEIDVEEKIDITSLEDEVKNIDKKISRAMDLYTNEVMDLPTVKKKVESLKKEKENLIEEIEDQKSINFEKNKINTTIENFKSIAKSDNTELKKAMLQTLINKIVVRGKNAEELEIYWNI